MTEITYTHNNKDDTHKAIECLDEFTHNWCMDCEETDKQHEPMFKCNKCIFINIFFIFKNARWSIQIWTDQQLSWAWY